MDGNDRQFFYSRFSEDEQNSDEIQSKNNFSGSDQDQINENPQKIYDFNENFSSKNNNIKTVDKIQNFREGSEHIINYSGYGFDFLCDSSQYNNYIYNNNFISNEDVLTYNDKEINKIAVNRKNDIIQGKDNTHISKFIVHEAKPINSSNLTLTKTFKKIFDEDIDKFEVKDDMKLTKRKRFRRTKKEIEISRSDTQKLESKSLDIKSQRVFGRKPKTNKPENIINFENNHNYKSDDNIIKKINTHFLESIRIWLNSSFINKNGEFKKKKDYFLKINPKLVATNLNRDFMLNLFNEKLEEIFSKEVSSKYLVTKKNNNKNLIQKINKEKNQPYISYILNLTFDDVLQIYCGNKKITGSNEIIDQKFPKIEDLLNKIAKTKRENKNSEENIKDYIERVSLLCLNYKTWFEIKYSRKKNENYTTEGKL